MFNTHNIPHRFTRVASEQELRECLEKEPYARYFVDAFTKNPHLVYADLAAHRDYVQQNLPQPLSEEAGQNADLPKCNVRAAKARQEGNIIYRQKKEGEDADEILLKALTKYNESICWAPTDSEDLAMGYANRSAAYYEMEEYELALANIALARKHNYPERLMPKLQTRELNCKSRIEADEQRKIETCTKFVLNVEVNPKIPFVAKGIAMKELPRFGRSMVAERDFKAGNVILCEKLTMAAINPEGKYVFCNYCSSLNCVSLIPCPQCVSAMYCNEECLEKGWKYTHRFECGICDKLDSGPFDECRLAPKMFFYGLTLFNDDVGEMMEYCNSHPRTGSNPFDLDYTEENPLLAAFKVFHTARPEPTRLLLHVLRSVSAIWYTIYNQQPLVRSLFVGKAEQDFMLKCIFDYTTVLYRLVAVRNANNILLHTVASVCNHSCNPNVHAMYQNLGELKFVVIRPIRKGDQICISYGPIYGEESNMDRNRQLSILDIDCACEVCNPNDTPRRLTKSKSYSNYHSHLDRMLNSLEDDSFSRADRLNAIQQFIQRYAYVDRPDQIREVVGLYRQALSRILEDVVTISIRRKIMAGMN